MKGPLQYGRREKKKQELGNNLASGLAIGRADFQRGQTNNAFDIYEQLINSYPEAEIDLLAELFDCYQQVQPRDRYTLYQSRLFDFGIKPSDKVLDMGSGHMPFPLATHLADISLRNHKIGRAGTPFKYLSGKPVYECDIENTGFNDQQFDFVYCSHVLEHVQNPENACNELMRIAKRGYIETPSKGKDIFLNSAKASNHRWSIDYSNNILIFSEYTPEEIEGLNSGILMSMHVNPQTKREKAFSALIYLKAHLFNVMFLWKDRFHYEVRRLQLENISPLLNSSQGVVEINQSQKSIQTSISKLQPSLQHPMRFMQVHTFYESYLRDFYSHYPENSNNTFQEQIQALVDNGFSAVHMIAPYMNKLGYETQLVIANNMIGQQKWLKENQIFTPDQISIHDIVRLQIEFFQPDVLYLTDPISFDSRFTNSLSIRPKLIIGWRGANVPEGTDWSDFDIMLSGLSAMRNLALKLGAKSSQYFLPGFPERFLEDIKGIKPIHDVVFSGQFTLAQHAKRNYYLEKVVEASTLKGQEFSCGLFLSGQIDKIPATLAQRNLGSYYGVDMFRAIRSGKIALDARGSIELKSQTGQSLDLAVNETINMRLFETTGCGVFLLTENFQNLSSFFEIGKEIETYSDEIELIEKIRYYLAHPKEREEIAKRGQERCLRDYSMENQIKALDKIINDYISIKTEIYPSKTVPSLQSQPLDHYIIPPQPVAAISTESNNLNRFLVMARNAIQSDNVEMAFTILNKAKEKKQLLQGIDHLRALCFLKMDRIFDAKQAILEELRYFPGDTEAVQLFDNLQKKYPDAIPDSQIGDEEFRGLINTIRPYTMLSEKRLYSLFTLTKQMCIDNLAGNVIECGVAAGGSTALLAYVVKKYSKSPRRVFAFDSFEGMPKPTENDRHGGINADETGWGSGTCSAPEESVKEICTRLGVWDIVTPIKGYFEDTLPVKRDCVGMIGLLHLDSDWYESTNTILHNLYDRIVNHGVMQIDDYGYWEGCHKAIHEFEAARKVKFTLHDIDGTGVWLDKPDCFPANPAIPQNLITEFEEVDPARNNYISQMSTNERFQLFYLLRHLLSSKNNVFFIEIGSYSGASLFLIYNTLKSKHKQVRGVAIEPSGTLQFYNLLNQLHPDVSHLKMLSNPAVSEINQIIEKNQKSADVILVDGDHHYEGVYQDILDYYPLLSPGGIMIFHDFLPPLDDNNRESILFHHAGNEPGIRQACQELMEQTYHCEILDLPLLYPTDPTQTQPHLPVIPGIFSTIRAYKKPIN